MIEKLNDEKADEMVESLNDRLPLHYNGLLKLVATIAIQKARDYYDAQIDAQAKTMEDLISIMGTFKFRITDEQYKKLLAVSKNERIADMRYLFIGGFLAAGGRIKE